MGAEDNCFNDDDDGLRHCSACEGAWKSLDGADACPFCGEQEYAKSAAALTAERDRLRAALAGTLDALVWCSGAHEFGPGGRARDGWLTVARPAMDAAQAAIDDGEAPTDAR